MNGLFFEEVNNLSPNVAEPYGVCMNGNCLGSCTSYLSEMNPGNNRCTTCVEGFVCGGTCTANCESCKNGCDSFCTNYVMF